VEVGLAVRLVAHWWESVRARWPDSAPERLTGELVRDQIGLMVGDLIAESRRRIAAVAPASVQDVRAATGPLIGFSETMAMAERTLKRFMYARLYHHPRQLEVAVQAGEIIAGLAQAYLADANLLPDRWRAALPADDPGRTRHIGDFIAGMTDRYAVARYREVVGPVDMPEGA
jgi:dGTPase